MDLITVQFDTRNLMAAQKLLDYFSKHTPAESLHKTVAVIVHVAKKRTPFVPVGRIDDELAVKVVPVIGVRGKPLKPNRAKNRNYNANLTPSGGGDFPAVPLSWLLVSARAKAGSNYNRITSSKWAIIGGHPLKGLRPGSRSAMKAMFQKVFDETIGRMVKSRRSSTHFFMVSWNVVGQKLIPHLPAEFRGAANTWFRGGDKVSARGDMGEVTPAIDGSLNAVCIIENRIGMSGQYPELDRRRNEAAHRILTPILQAAIDTEFHGKMEFFWKQSLSKQKAALDALGVVIDI